MRWVAVAPTVASAPDSTTQNRTFAPACPVRSRATDTSSSIVPNSKRSAAPSAATTACSSSSRRSLITLASSITPRPFTPAHRP